ncbi:putative polypeptide N-acetylgalactosaminyltransferase 10 [Uloborus diversus]|uniref:putative polypeptide N-acetylgalactosaminyltransferase 10 n=1 Tax=Uloborus diversus TaxID=327109 RepID=UPI002409B747|nr:putative polypeptide N-acetylgalactosaminyltransferase 10 [Uloborus diversus]
MVRRNRKRLFKLVLTICAAVFCGGFLLKVAVTSLELQTSLMVAVEHDRGENLLTRLSGIGGSQQTKEPLRKSWYEPISVIIPHGPGEQGAPFVLPSGLDKTKEELYKENGFNALVSDFISLNRTLPDIRHPNCKAKEYLSRLPKVSVVIPFHNEHWTTLLRTVTSVVSRSPIELIREIILVDDYSTKAQLKNPLDQYVRQHFSNVRVVRANKREGLIRARLLGAKAAVGEILVFLDSHTEANVDWLPPLLEPIALNRRTVTCPFIDVIDYETLGYRAQDEGARGAFDWELYYKRLPLLPDDLKHPANPFKSPVMAGGLFAIDRSFFWELGGYDSGLDVWGGEQYELSFKIWQCGGQMLDVPCSRVGHIYRKFAPFPNPGLGDFVGRNYKRVAEVWMDEYKEFLYMRRPHYRVIEVGNLTEQKALRKKLECKSFRWFMENVAFDQPKKYPPIEPPDYAKGELRSGAGDLCIDTKFRRQNERFGLDTCIKDNPNQGGEQQFVLSWHKDIRPVKRSVCFDVSSSEKHVPIVLWNCHGMQGNQLWKYDMESQHLVHMLTGTCLDCDLKKREIFMNPCDRNKKTQIWRFEMINATAILNW